MHFLIRVDVQNWSEAMLKKCEEVRFDILLKDPKAEAEKCQLKCFNEREFKGLLAEARSSVSSFNAEKSSAGMSLQESKVIRIFVIYGFKS